MSKYKGFMLRILPIHYDKLKQINEKTGISITSQIRIAIVDYLRGKDAE